MKNKEYLLAIAELFNKFERLLNINSVSVDEDFGALIPKYSRLLKSQDLNNVLQPGYHRQPYRSCMEKGKNYPIKELGVLMVYILGKRSCDDPCDRFGINMQLYISDTCRVFLRVQEKGNSYNCKPEWGEWKEIGGSSESVNIIDDTLEESLDKTYSITKIKSLIKIIQDASEECCIDNTNKINNLIELINKLIVKVNDLFERVIKLENIVVNHEERIKILEECCEEMHNKKNCPIITLEYEGRTKKINDNDAFFQITNTDIDFNPAYFTVRIRKIGSSIELLDVPYRISNTGKITLDVVNYNYDRLEIQVIYKDKVCVVSGENTPWQVEEGGDLPKILCPILNLICLGRTKTNENLSYQITNTDVDFSYPGYFNLEIREKISGNIVNVNWTISNTGLIVINTSDYIRTELEIKFLYNDGKCKDTGKAEFLPEKDFKPIPPKPDPKPDDIPCPVFKLMHLRRFESNTKSEFAIVNYLEVHDLSVENITLFIYNMNTGNLVTDVPWEIVNDKLILDVTNYPNDRLYLSIFYNDGVCKNGDGEKRAYPEKKDSVPDPEDSDYPGPDGGKYPRGIHLRFTPGNASITEPRVISYNIVPKEEDWEIITSILIDGVHVNPEIIQTSGEIYSYTIPVGKYVDVIINTKNVQRLECMEAGEEPFDPRYTKTVYEVYRLIDDDIDYRNFFRGLNIVKASKNMTLDFENKNSGKLKGLFRKAGVFKIPLDYAFQYCNKEEDFSDLFAESHIRTSELKDVFKLHPNFNGVSNVKIIDGMFYNTPILGGTVLDIFAPIKQSLVSAKYCFSDAGSMVRFNLVPNIIMNCPNLENIEGFARIPLNKGYCGIKEIPLIYGCPKLKNTSGAFLGQYKMFGEIPVDYFRDVIALKNSTNMFNCCFNLKVKGIVDKYLALGEPTNYVEFLMNLDLPMDVFPNYNGHLAENADTKNTFYACVGFGEKIYNEKIQPNTIDSRNDFNAIITVSGLVPSFK